jgi:hypothetical protein
MMLTALIGFIDIFIMHKPFEVFFQSVLSLQFGTRKWWVFSGFLAGLIYSIMSDFKRRKAKKEVSQGT